MIAAQMGDTHYRDRILWMLLTCRPDLLPIDLKRELKPASDTAIASGRLFPPAQVIYAVSAGC